MQSFGLTKRRHRRTPVATRNAFRQTNYRGTAQEVYIIYIDIFIYLYMYVCVHGLGRSFITFLVFHGDREP